MDEDLQSRALQAAWQWLLKEGRERISVEEYQQLRLEDRELPDIDDVYRRFGNWDEFERSANAFAALMDDPAPEPQTTPLGPRSRLSDLASRLVGSAG